MSVRISARVWASSNQKGSMLLTLLALADRANDDGYCWPGIESLSEKTRLSERQQTRLVAELAESGELYVEQGGGKHQTNCYLVLTGMAEDEICRALRHYFRLGPLEAHQVARELLQKQLDRIAAQEPKEAPANADNLSPLADASCESKPDIQHVNPDIQRPIPDIHGRNPVAAVSQYVKDPSGDSSGNPSERGRARAALSHRQKVSVLPSKVTARRPGSSPAPPPVPPTPSQEQEAMVAALRRACALSDQPSPRKEKALLATASRLVERGCSPEQVATFRDWWDRYSHGRLGRPPHLGQVEDHLGRAIEPEQRPRPRQGEGNRTQPQITQAELEALAIAKPISFSGGG